jgi:hypothetical protein
MPSETRPIYCSNGKLEGLCQEPKCDNQVCGCCCYCGRPICEEHGKHEPTYRRYYCKQHGPENTIEFTIEIIKMVFTIAREKNINVTDIGVKEFTVLIMERLGLQYPSEFRG